MAQVVNNILLRLRPKSDVVEIPLLRFLADLNNTAHSYKELFHLTETLELFDVEFLDNSIKHSVFSKFLAIKDDMLQIHMVPRMFQAMSKIVVEASLTRSKSLIEDIDRLRSKYTTASSEPIVEPTPVPESAADVVPVVVVEKVQTENTASDGTVQPLVVSSTVGQDDTAAATTETEMPEESGFEKEKTPEVMIIDEKEDLNPPNQDIPAEAVSEAAINNVKSRSSSIAEMPSEEIQNEPNLKNEVKDEHIDTVPVKEPHGAEDTTTEVSSSVSQNNTAAVKIIELAPSFKEDPEGEQESLDSEQIEENSHTLEQSVPKATDASEIQSEHVAQTQKEVVMSENDEDDDVHSRKNRTRSQSIHSAEKRSASPLGQASHKHKRFQSIAINLIKTIEGHRYSSPFLLPVTAPDYGETVKQATDLKTIMKALKLKQEPPKYETLKELERDIMLMFANCVMFNKSSSPIVSMAKEMKDEVSETFKMFEDAESTIN